MLLIRFGIESRASHQKKDGRGNQGPYHRIFITAESNLRKFNGEIGFGHPKKMKRLGRAIGLMENTNVDLMPGTGELIRDIRKAVGLTQKELSAKSGFGKTRTVINAYESGSRTPSRNSLRKINEVFSKEFNSRIKELESMEVDDGIERILGSEKPLAGFTKYAKKICTMETMQKNTGLGGKLIYYYLKKPGRITKGIRERIVKGTKEAYTEKMAEMSNAKKLILHINSITGKNIRWDKILEIRKEEEKTAYYDLTLDSHNTFVANGIMVSNCMGTVHANSSQETIVRVTNPPMNVPEVMMAGLNFILIQHLLHDRKRGAIRRLTEIAEVTNVLEGKTKTTVIFKRDAASDTLKKTKEAAEYLTVLEDRTGMTQKQISEEISQRQKFLETLVKEKVAGMRNVTQRIKEHTDEKK